MYPLILMLLPPMVPPPPVVDTDALIADLVKNQFVFSGETDEQQRERAARVKREGKR